MCTYTKDQQKVMFDDCFFPMLDMIKAHLIPRSTYQSINGTDYNGSYLHQKEYDIQNSTACSSKVKKQIKSKKKRKSNTLDSTTDEYVALLRTNYRLTPDEYKGPFLNIMSKRIYRSMFIHQNCEMLKSSDNMATIICTPSMKICFETIVSLMKSNFSVFPLSRTVSGFVNTKVLIDRFVTTLQHDCEEDIDITDLAAVIEGTTNKSISFEKLVVDKLMPSNENALILVGKFLHTFCLQKEYFEQWFAYINLTSRQPKTEDSSFELFRLLNMVSFNLSRFFMGAFQYMLLQRILTVGKKEKRSFTDRILLMGKLTLDYLLPKLILDYVQDFDNSDDNLVIKEGVVEMGKSLMKGKIGAYKFLHLLLFVIPPKMLPNENFTNLSSLLKPLLQYEYEFDDESSEESDKSGDHPKNTENFKQITKGMRYKFWWLFEICTMSGVDAEDIDELKESIDSFKTPAKFNNILLDFVQYVLEGTSKVEEGRYKIRVNLYRKLKSAPSDKTSTIPPPPKKKPTKMKPPKKKAIKMKSPKTKPSKPNLPVDDEGKDLLTCNDIKL